MATKKQRRAAALKKHEDFMEEMRASGLKALKADQTRQLAQKKAAEESAKKREQTKSNAAAAKKMHKENLEMSHG